MSFFWIAQETVLPLAFSAGYSPSVGAGKAITPIVIMTHSVVLI